MDLATILRSFDQLSGHNLRNNSPEIALDLCLDPAGSVNDRSKRRRVGLGRLRRVGRRLGRSKAEQIVELGGGDE